MRNQISSTVYAEASNIDHYDTIFVPRTAVYIDISLTISPLNDVDGRIIGASKIARDNTERKRAQDQQKPLVNR